MAQADLNTLVKRVLDDIRVEYKDEFDRNFTRQAFFNEAWQRRKSPFRPGKGYFRRNGLNLPKKPVSKLLSMSKRNDITTPEGYFENLQQRLSEIPARPVRVSMVHRLAPYAAIAASITRKANLRRMNAKTDATTQSAAPARQAQCRRSPPAICPAFAR